MRPAAPGEPSNTPEIFLALGATIREKDLPSSLFEDLLSAFRQDVTVTRYASWADVMDYCRRSANPVGRLVLRIAGYRDARLDGWSDAICTALQLTNFWQDLKIDFDRGRIYLPEEEMRAHGAAEGDLAGAAHDAEPWQASGRVRGRANARALRRRPAALRCGSRPPGIRASRDVARRHADPRSARRRRVRHDSAPSRAWRGGCALVRVAHAGLVPGRARSTRRVSHESRHQLLLFVPRPAAARSAAPSSRCGISAARLTMPWTKWCRSMNGPVA